MPLGGAPAQGASSTQLGTYSPGARTANGPSRLTPPAIQRMMPTADVREFFMTCLLSVCGLPELFGYGISFSADAVSTLLIVLLSTFASESIALAAATGGSYAAQRAARSRRRASISAIAAIPSGLEKNWPTDLANVPPNPLISARLRCRSGAWLLTS